MIGHVIPGRLVRTFALGLPLFFLAGCAAEMRCGDSDSLSLAEEIIEENLEKAVWYREISDQITGSTVRGATTLTRNAELRSSTCRATYAFEYRGKSHESEFEYEIHFLEDEDDFELSLDIDTVKSKVMAAALFER